jgi:sugar O-acyltransferase (sialic acid O-acetyltransferase NeuD family)
MIDIIIVGSGGHAAEIDEYIKHNQKVNGTKELNVIGFLDDNPANYARYKLSAPLLGGVKNHEVRMDNKYIIAIANLLNRGFIVTKFKTEGANFAAFVDGRAYISDSAIIGEGSIIGPNVNIGPNVKIGKFTLINSRASIGHDSIIGDFNIISPNVCFSGFTEIGDENMFGINSATIPGIKVGSCNKIAAGMILDQNIGNESIVFHRFKERIIAIPKT